MKPIPVVPPPRSTSKLCPNPIAAITATQLLTLDPTGARTRLFSPTNLERVQPGDILLTRFRTGDPFSGIVLNIRRRDSLIDTAVLLRNTLTRVGVEMWVKVYSPNVEGIEVVKRKTSDGRHARRAKLYYLRQARHDVTGGVEGFVRQYVRSRAGAAAGGAVSGGRTPGVNLGRKKVGKKGKVGGKR